METLAVKYKGVSQRVGSQRFVARVHIPGNPQRQSYHLSQFDTAEEAARAADLGHLATQGWGVGINFPAEQYTN